MVVEGQQAACFFNSNFAFSTYVLIASNDCTEINFRMNRQKIIKGIVYNNIKTVQAAELHVGSTSHKGVIIQLDTNNIPEENKEISDSIIANMLNQVAGKIKPGEIKELI